MYIISDVEGYLMLGDVQVLKMLLRGPQEMLPEEKF
jgi:hypothetical protein